MSEERTFGLAPHRWMIPPYIWIFKREKYCYCDLLPVD